MAYPLKGLADWYAPLRTYITDLVGTKVDSSTLTAALGAKADLVNGRIPTSQIPNIAILNLVSVADEAARLALTPVEAQPGDMAVQTNDGSRYLLVEADPTVPASWVALADSTMVSVNGQTGVVVLSAEDVGALSAGANLSDLGNVVSARSNLGLGTAATSAISALTARGNHTGVQPASTISDLGEAVEDFVGSLVVGGTNMTVEYDDTAGTLTLHSTGTATTDLTAEDIVQLVAGTLGAGPGLRVEHDTNSGSITYFLDSVSIDQVTDLTVALNARVTSSELNAALANRVTTAQLDTALSDRVTDVDLDAALASLEEDLNDRYYLKSEIGDVTVDYVAMLEEGLN